MPEDFDKCVSSGGTTRTLTGPNKKYGLKEGEYRHACLKNGTWHFGEIKQKDQEKK